MYKKICSHCYQPSFSSSERGKWLCPVCNHDITNVFHQNAEAHNEMKVQYESFNSRFAGHIGLSETINEYV